MRLLFGFAAIGLLAGTYFVCPEAMRQQVNDRLTPGEETLTELRAGMDALMGHLDGPGEMGPDAPT